MKRTLLLTLLAAASVAGVQAQPMAAPPAFAPTQAPSFVDRARVLAADAQYETVQVPRQDCRAEWVTEQRGAVTTPSGGSNIGGAVIGGVVGALVGNQIGKGHGREAATGAGAVAGAVIGSNVGGSNVPGTVQPVYEQRQVQNCRTVMDTQTRLNGYRVTYEYRGHQYATVTREQPGNTLPVRVSVMPEPEYHPQAELPRRP